MKHVSTAIVLVAGLALGWVVLNAQEQSYVRPGEDSGVPSTLPATVPEGHVARSYAVDGMCCTGCPPKLYERLVALEAVKNAAIDFETETALVYVAAGTVDETLIEALSFDDYSARVLP